MLYVKPEPIKNELGVRMILQDLIGVTTDIERKRQEMEELKIRQSLLREAVEEFAKEVFDGNQNTVD